MPVNLRNPIKNETLFCRKDSQQSVGDDDKHVIGVFKSDGKLVDHMLIELSDLIDNFPGNTEENHVSICCCCWSEET